MAHQASTGLNDDEDDESAVDDDDEEGDDFDMDGDDFDNDDDMDVDRSPWVVASICCLDANSG